jgi:MazG family protein
MPVEPPAAPPTRKPLDQTGESLTRLVEVMNRLLAPDGCPWDREQTLDTLRPFLVEETYEVLEALDDADPREHCEELGDLLLQIVFQAALRAREAGAPFGIDDVVSAIVAKLVRRHPHVFADAKVSGAEQVLAQWGEIKAAERKEKAKADSHRALTGVPKAMPALLRALRIGEKAARVGFDWPNADGARAKVAEEIVEVDEARASGDAARVREELGDLLFATVSYARLLGLDPEDALHQATHKFERRFRSMEDALAAEGKEVKGTDFATLDALWEASKRK